MNCELRKLSPDDGRDVYDMLQQIPKDENGFINGCNGITYDEFKRWLIECEDIANGTGLEEWMVPQYIYWLYADGLPVGMGKLRHYLTPKLKEEGGHIGYAIVPAQRNKGYGRTLLKMLVDEAKGLNISRILLTIHNHNAASIKVAIANNGTIEDVNAQRHYIWIDC